MQFSSVGAALAEFLSSDYKKIPWLRLKFKILTSKLSRITSSSKKLTPTDYLKMQRGQYEAAAAVAKVEPGRLRGDCVAVVDWKVQDTFADYKKYLFARLGDTKHLFALEYGCGPGRNLQNWWREFARIDGVDISQKNLDNARTLLQGVVPENRFPNLYITQGADAGAAPNNSYDFCFSVICMQHIAVWSIRQRILASLHGVLKPGGCLAIQLTTNPRTAGTKQCVGYRDDRLSAGVTNGGCDVCVDDPEEVVKDLKTLGFGEIEFYIAPVPAEISAVFSDFVYFTAIKT